MIQPKSTSRLLAEVEAAVLAAGDLIRTEFHRPEGPRVMHGKALVDVEVEEFLKHRLLAAHPAGWLGEETEGRSAVDEDIWIVDPQDGTDDFLKGRRGSAISVALLSGGQYVLGIVCAPLAPDDDGDLISWAAGGSVRRNGRAVEAAARLTPEVVAMNANAADYASSHAEAFGKLRVRAMPSPAYRLALAAAGEVDAAVSLTCGLEPWDIAGGQALLVGAGFDLVDRHGQPIAPGSGANGCIGGRPELIAGLVRGLRVQGRAEPRRPAQAARRIADAASLSRAQGCLIGQLAGDALGSAVEFETAAAIARRHPHGVTLLTDGGTFNLIAGQPTDDSEMALALARSLVARGEFDAADVGRAYVRWRNSRPFDIGGTTSAGIAAIAAGRRAESDSQANGALMRVSPIGLFAAGDPALAARLGAEDARLTHPHAFCQAASAAFAAAIAAGVAGGDARAMWTAAHDHAGDGEGAQAIRQRLVAALKVGPEEFGHQMGWVLIAFQNAFHWLMQGAPLSAAVSVTVARGGDTDTNAAICGALIGALQGRDAAPLQWRNAILTCRPAPAPGVIHPRPKDYWPDDALDLAEALLAARAAA